MPLSALSLASREENVVRMQAVIGRRSEDLAMGGSESSACVGGRGTPRVFLEAMYMLFGTSYILSTYSVLMVTTAAI